MVLYALLHVAVLAITIVALSRRIPGVRITSGSAALLVAVVFSVLNFFLGWLLGGVVRAVLFLPAIFSFGLLFLLVPLIVNTVLLWMTDKLLKSFEIKTLRALVLCSTGITLVNAVFHVLPRFCSGACPSHMNWV